jgi:hypothetical protein
MENLFNTISEEEKNRILEMHSDKKNVIRESNIETLIKRKLSGEKLSGDEMFKIHKWLFNNDESYSKSVDKILKKGLKKNVPKGTKIE